MAGVMRIAYTAVVADLFHYGHLNMLKTAKSISDLHVCGVLTDDAANTFRPRPISNFEERKAVISALNCVDEIMAQDSLDPTKNLKALHERFPESKIILVHGDNWERVPGREYVESIGGRLFQPPYYGRLSDSKVMEAIRGGRGRSQSFELFTEHFQVGNIIYYDDKRDKRKILSTKANTLKALQPLLKKSIIERTFVFNVGDWYENREKIIAAISNTFSGDKIAIRSSAINEDTFTSSLAGCYTSVLDIPSSEGEIVGESIEKVISSYDKMDTWLLDNQILVQMQAEDVVISGVVFSWNLIKDSPYYVINYDDTTGKTNTVTSGLEGQKVEIFRGCNIGLIPEKWRMLLESIKEIETIVPRIPLDIEFAIKSRGDVTILQVRPITIGTFGQIGEKDEVNRDITEKLEIARQRFNELSEPLSHLSGSANAFSDMAFWNPSEIIGDNPNYLSYSLYAYIITDSAWHMALSPLGYADVNPAKLMVLFGNKPYIDLRATFNALTPESVGNELREKLVDFYLKKLKANPHVHDKVEFEVVYNTHNFTFGERSKELLDNGFTQGEIDELRDSLAGITNEIILSSTETFKAAFDSVEHMLAKRSQVMASVGCQYPNDPVKAIENAITLLDDCQIHGTIPFSQLARMAFIGKGILKSMVDAGIVTDDTYQGVLGSVNTVASEFERDFNAYLSGELDRDALMEKYGHLRPGTYEITTPRYVDDSSLLDVEKPREGVAAMHEVVDFRLPKVELAMLSNVLEKHDFKCTSQQLLEFIRKSIEGRERLKYEFTKNLSDAIELIASAGVSMGFDRGEMSHLDVGSLKLLLHQRDLSETKYVWRSLIDSRMAEKRINEKLSLPPLLFSETDFLIVKSHTAQPNFITNRRVEGEVVLGDDPSQVKGIGGKIVLLEKADPGYDWLFTKNIAGLVTKYGGAASHMAIRSAEFNLPAAIGCGEDLFERLKRTRYMILDCNLHKIEGR